MDDAVALYFVLLIVYLAECAFFFRRDSVFFHAPFGGKLRLQLPDRLFGNHRGAIFFGNPLPPLGVVFVCQNWPLSISPEGILARTLHSQNPGHRHEQSGIFVSFTDFKSIETIGKEIRINGRPFLKVESTRFARFLEVLIARTARARPDNRKSVIQEGLNAFMNVDDLNGMRKDFFKKTLLSRALACALLLHFFAVAPLALRFMGSMFVWLWILAGMLSLLLPILTAHVLIHRRLFPDDASNRWGDFFFMLFSPPAAVRAVDFLSRDLFGARCPLAVARALSGADEFAEFARKTLRDICFPLPLHVEADDPGAFTLKWFTELYNSELEKIIVAGRLDPEALLDTGNIGSSLDRSFCPRCETPYMILEGHCDVCGIPLVRLPDKQRGSGR